MVSPSMRAIARRRAELRMTDSCTVVRETRSEDPDPATGKHATTSTTIYNGPCEFVAANTAVHEVTSAGRPVAEQGATLRVPVDHEGSAQISSGDTATVHLSSHDTTAPPLVARVGGTHQQTFAASRRLPVEVVTRG